MVNTTKKVIKELNLRRTLFLFSNLFIPLSRLREGLGGGGLRKESTLKHTLFTTCCSPRI
ncbi:hypothetical protein [Coxiella burnetii]|uniref:Uncharacterized protein n=1 Tax=Coxiella burnetii (strain RSA 493 / Nine Mile phase I) TaxID=227377 RepID=Q83F21_COXBU|nr:hypothetical protein [Coxiella burnetii]NP_819180.2 hypothetical protein CBU_0130 [Coxiella burnetii RSA 493]AAO89694.2 hypothetical protein CBU_0130 [Coxiella burnetii RSA 493]ARI65046.1 hypothetical protein B7L74_00675 [Coxiella burnetii]MCF2093051.1 hypothetical protein [Coxiella burnetii]MCF2095144.1 hypothetical protein [Coxiella burnetii]MCF2097119.1 hypothetical protein [Coxiella burnetii]